MNFEELTKIDCIRTKKKKIILTDEIFCTRKYPQHPYGCPNYGKKKLCPPNTSKINLDKYDHFILFYIKFDFNKYCEIRKIEHSKWTDKQVKCVLYWQGAVRKLLKNYLFEYLKLFHRAYDLFMCGSDIYNYPSMEAVGINVFSTMRLNGIKLEIHPTNYIYLVSLICLKKCDKSKNLGEWL